MKTYAIILASGTAQRFDTQGARLKQFAKVSGRTLLEHVVELFEHTEGVNEIIIVITPGYRETVENLLLGGNYHKVTRILEGGATRKESSHIGIFSIPDAEAQVIIHDCARPMLSQRIIRDCLEALQQHDAVDVAIPSADTIIRVNKHGFIEEIPERSQLLRGQTPQCFKLSLIRRAHELAAEEESYTDDCGLIVRHKLASVYVVAGERANIKVTWPEDLHLADKFFQIRSMNELPEDAATLSRLRAKIVVVFGGTSGIGESIVQQAREFGSTCIPLSCRTGCDVTNPTMVRAALEEIARQHGRIEFHRPPARRQARHTGTRRHYGGTARELSWRDPRLPRRYPISPENTRFSHSIHQLFLHARARTLCPILLRKSRHRESRAGACGGTVCRRHSSERHQPCPHSYTHAYCRLR